MSGSTSPLNCCRSAGGPGKARARVPPEMGCSCAPPEPESMSARELRSRAHGSGPLLGGLAW